MVFDFPDSLTLNSHKIQQENTQEKLVIKELSEVIPTFLAQK